MKIRTPAFDWRKNIFGWSKILGNIENAMKTAKKNFTTGAGEKQLAQTSAIAGGPSAMINIRTLIHERMQFLRDLKPLMRATDGTLEKFERELRRLLNRKKHLPDSEDLVRLVVFMGDTATNLKKSADFLKKGYIR